jgi:Co/Zn/Cd efflux system component
MWFAVFIVFLTLSSIAQEMTVVAFVGFVSNLVGALIFRLAEGGPHERT